MFHQTVMSSLIVYQNVMSSLIVPLKCNELIVCSIKIEWVHWLFYQNVISIEQYLDQSSSKFWIIICAHHIIKIQTQHKNHIISPSITAIPTNFSFPCCYGNQPPHPHPLRASFTPSVARFSLYFYEVGEKSNFFQKFSFY